MVTGLCRTEDERQTCFEWLWVRSRDLVRLSWPAVASLASRLVEERELTGKEATQIIKAEPPDPREVRVAQAARLDRRRLSRWLGGAASRPSANPL